MTDIRLKQYYSLEGVTLDFLLLDSGSLDEREELATSVRVALGTDALAAVDDILPDPDSTDRRGWWGNLEAGEIWDGWDIGTKNWLLARAKITQAPAEEGSTIERARLYTLAALQPFIDKGIASQVTVTAKRTELQRIEVNAIIYRGPLSEIDLRFQILWDELDNAYVYTPASIILIRYLTVGSPELGSPVLSTKYQFVSVGIAVGSPALSRPVFSRSNTLISVSKTVASPVLQTATIVQVLDRVLREDGFSALREDGGLEKRET